jgi:hypothetical protein
MKQKKEQKKNSDTDYHRDTEVRIIKLNEVGTSHSKNFGESKHFKFN